MKTYRIGFQFPHDTYITRAESYDDAFIKFFKYFRDKREWISKDAFVVTRIYHAEALTVKFQNFVGVQYLYVYECKEI